MPACAASLRSLTGAPKIASYLAIDASRSFTATTTWSTPLNIALSSVDLGAAPSACLPKPASLGLLHRLVGKAGDPFGHVGPAPLPTEHLVRQALAESEAVGVDQEPLVGAVAEPGIGEDLGGERLKARRELRV